MMSDDSTPETSNQKLKLEKVSVSTDPLSTISDKKEWVKFEDDEENRNASKKTSDIVIDINNKHAEEGTNSNFSPRINKAVNENDYQPAVIDVAIRQSDVSTVDLSAKNEPKRFTNGEIIVTILPINEYLPWLTPPTFRPELVPEELMAQGLTLTVEDYVNAMEILVNDYSFKLYNVCYKRILMIWIMLAFIILLALLFSGITGILLFSLGVCWLFFNAMSIFICMWIKLQLSRGLEKCLARVNKLLLRHHIIIALDDRGNISCHKVHLTFLYVETLKCVDYINEFLEKREQSGQAIEGGWELDIDAPDIYIQGTNPTRISRKQARGESLILRYAQRWAKERIRGNLKVTNNEPARHMDKHICLCQFIEQHLKCKPQGSLCWPTLSNSNHLYQY